jgi:hypothetical protein
MANDLTTTARDDEPVGMSMTMTGDGPTDPAIVAAAEREKARLQMAFMVAMSRPRHEENARARILANCRRREFAVKAIYEKPMGGERVKGLSIRFVEMALREWGNVLTEASVVHEDERGRRVRISAMDLQTNTAFTREVFIARVTERSRLDEGRELLGTRKNSKGRTTYRLVATDDELDLATNSAVSKCLRNEGGRLLPEDLKSESMHAIDAALDSAGAQDIGTYRRAILDSFTRLGIQPVELEKVLGHSISTSTAKELTSLETIYHTLKSGEAVWNDYVQAEEGAAPLAERLAEMKARAATTASPASPASAAAPVASIFPETAASSAGTSPSTTDPAPATKRKRRTAAESVAEASQPNDPKGPLTQEPAPPPPAPASDPEVLTHCDYCQTMKPEEGFVQVHATNGKDYAQCADCYAQAQKAIDRVAAHSAGIAEVCYFCNQNAAGGDKFEMLDKTKVNRCLTCKGKQEAALAGNNANGSRTVDQMRADRDAARTGR